MYETLKMMKSIITGKEKELSEKELIELYQKEKAPNILAYMFVSNFGYIFELSKNYLKLTYEDKASFCLQELDKCLLNYDIKSPVKFITYFRKCYYNRLRTEAENLGLYKNRIIPYESRCIGEDDYFIDFDVEDIDLILSNYNLTDKQKRQCKLFNSGYKIKEIANIFNCSAINIYKSKQKIKNILNYSINY